MRYGILPLTALLFLLAGPLSLPVNGQEQQTETAGTLHDKEQYEKSMKERLGKLGARLDNLKKKADAKSVQVEGKLKERLAEAEQKRQVAARKLEELGRASQDTWHKFSADMEKAAKEFERSFERIKNREE